MLIIGGATKDAEEKTFDSGKTKVRFSLGVGKRADDTSIYADCEAWGRAAELAKTIKKGDLVLAAGDIRSHEYNGKTYTSLNCEIVINASLMGAAGLAQAAGQVNTQASASASTAPTQGDTGFTEIAADNDSLPF